MPWPVSQDYNEAIQSPDSSFADPELRGGQPVTNALGMPMPRSGNFADVYEFVGASGARWAVKCFTREVMMLQDRYTEISKHLVQAKLPFTVDFNYLAHGIRIRGQWYPVLKMQWVEGLLLNEFVRNNLAKPALLEGLGQIWLRMARRLRDADLAHADLQHGNVLLVPGSKATSLSVKLIDYDGMWVPTLAGTKSGEVGHPNFQHPQRLQKGIYNAEVDRLPLLAVACALRRLAVAGKSLWDRHDNGDNLLFRETDLANPAGSRLFKELWNLNDATAHDLTGHLTIGLTGPLLEVPLLQDLIDARGVRALSSAEENQVAGILGPGAVVHRAPLLANAIAAEPTAPAPPARTASAFEDVENMNVAKPSTKRERSSNATLVKGIIAVAVVLVLLGGITLAGLGALFFFNRGKPDVPVQADGKKPKADSAKPDEKKPLDPWAGGEVWSGTHTLDGEDYPASLHITKREKNQIWGKLRWFFKKNPEAITLVEGTVQGDSLTLNATVIEAGKNLFHPVSYQGKIVGDKASGTWVYKHAKGEVLGKFNYSHRPAIKALEHWAVGEVWKGTHVLDGHEYPATLTVTKQEKTQFWGKLRWHYRKEPEAITLIEGTVNDDVLAFDIKTIEAGVTIYSPVAYRGKITGDKASGTWVFKDKKGDVKGTFSYSHVPKKAVLWEPLFNGKDLTGWKKFPQGQVPWIVDKGILTTAGPAPGGFLFTERGDFENFHVRFEAMCFGKNGGGQGFRMGFTLEPRGYYVQTNCANRAAGDAIGGHYTGSLFTRTLRKKQIASDLLVPVYEPLAPPDSWFTQEIIAKGDQITILVDGKKVVDRVEPQSIFKQGHIAIFNPTAAPCIAYRKIEVMELPGAGAAVEKKPATLAERLAGTKWINSNKATFEWDKDSVFFHNGNKVNYQFAGDRQISIHFSPTHTDTLTFDAELTRFEQISSSVPKIRPLFTGKLVERTP